MGMQEGLAMRLRGAYLTMHRRAQALYASVGATADQSVLLGLLADEDGLTQRELVARSYSDSSTIAAILRLLEARGLVRRVRDERDGRARRVSLTAAGRRRHRELTRLRLKRQAPLTSLFTPRQLKFLMEGLARIIDFSVAAEARRAGHAPATRCATRRQQDRRR